VQRISLPLAFCLLSLSCYAVDTVSHDVSCQNTTYQYLLYAEPHTAPEPAVLLLHGAGDQAGTFMDAWSHLAHREHAVLVAPQIPRDEKFEAIAPAVFRCVMEDAGKQTAIDAKRIYLFGHSMGGYLGFDTAMHDSDYFAAAAVHGSDIADQYLSILKQAKRKIPIAIYIGDSDPYFPIGHVRKTAELLHKDGFPVHFVEIAGHDHEYYGVAEQVNKDAWKFLASQALK